MLVEPTGLLEGQRWHDVLVRDACLLEGQWGDHEGRHGGPLSAEVVLNRRHTWKQDRDQVVSSDLLDLAFQLHPAVLEPGSDL